MNLISAVLCRGVWHPVSLQFQIVAGIGELSLLGLTFQQQVQLRERLKTVLSLLKVKRPCKKIVIDFRPLNESKPLPTGTFSIGPEFASLVGLLLLLKNQSTKPHPINDINLDKIQALKDSLLIGNLDLVGRLLPLHPTQIEPLNALLTQLSFTHVIGPVPTAPLNKAPPIEFSYIEIKHLNDLNKLKSLPMQRAPTSSPHPLSHCLPHTQSLLKLKPLFTSLIEDYQGTQPELLGSLLLSLSCRLPLLIGGEPGSGKTRALQQLAKMASVLRDLGFVKNIRMPHTSLTYGGLVGSGFNPHGEASKSHNGILILDEMSCFSSQTLEGLRHILDTGAIYLCRSHGSVKLDAKLLLWATTNLCPCGYRLSYHRPCRCKPGALNSYLNKLNGPLVSRFALQILLNPLQEYKSGPQPFKNLVQGSCQSTAQRQELFDCFSDTIIQFWNNNSQKEDYSTTENQMKIIPTNSSIFINQMDLLNKNPFYTPSLRDIRWGHEIAKGIGHLFPSYKNLSEGDKMLCVQNLRKISHELFG